MERWLGHNLAPCRCVFTQLDGVQNRTMPKAFNSNGIIHLRRGHRGEVRKQSEIPMRNWRLQNLSSGFEGGGREGGTIRGCMAVHCGKWRAAGIAETDCASDHRLCTG